MILIVGEAVPAITKPPAADDSLRISTGGRCGFGASAPSLIRVSPMDFSGAERVQLYHRSWSNSSSFDQP